MEFEIQQHDAEGELAALRRRVIQLEEEIFRKEARLNVLTAANTSGQHPETLTALWLEQIPIALAILDQQMHYLFVSRRWQEDCGLTYQEMIGRSHSQIFPESRDRWREIYQHCLLDALHHSQEGTHTRADGTTEYCAWDILPWYNAGGEVGGLIVSKKAISHSQRTEHTHLLNQVVDRLEQEIRDRQRTEECLRRSEERYRSFVMAGADIFWLADPEGKLTFATDFTADLHNRQPENEGDGWLNIVHPDDRANAIHVWQEAVAHKQLTRETIYLYENEFRVQVNGFYRYMVARGVPVLKEDGTVREWVGLCQDIHDRKQAEEELRVSQQNLRTIFDNSQDAIFIHALDGTILDVNDRMLEMFRVSREQAPHFSIAEDYSSLENPIAQLQTIWERILAGEVMHLEWKCRRPQDESTFDAEVMLRKLELNGEDIILANVRDLSDRKAAEAALQKSEAQLRKQAQFLQKTLHELRQTQTQMIQSEKMSSLGQIVAGVAHEINNPVNFIHGNLAHAKTYVQDLLRLLELYQQHFPHPPQEIVKESQAIDLDFLKKDIIKLCQSMQSGTERIREIVLSLRNFSRLDEAECKKADLHQGIDSTLMILQQQLKEKSDRPAIEVIKNYGTLPVVECYPGQLNQVFMNILVNAIDAFDGLQNAFKSEKSPQIKISTERISAPFQDNAANPTLNWVAIHIKDNGVGMSEPVKNRLFDPFFTTKAVGKGTGLGMSISYQIVTEKHQGILECVSSLGEGSEFIIKIPIVQNRGRLKSLR